MPTGHYQHRRGVNRTEVERVLAREKDQKLYDLRDLLISLWLTPPPAPFPEERIAVIQREMRKLLPERDSYPDLDPEIVSLVVGEAAKLFKIRADHITSHYIRMPVHINKIRMTVVWALVQVFGIGSSKAMEAVGCYNFWKYRGRSKYWNQEMADRLVDIVKWNAAAIQDNRRTEAREASDADAAEADQREEGLSRLPGQRDVSGRNVGSGRCPVE